MTNKGKKVKPHKYEKETLRKRIVVVIASIFFCHILGETKRLAPCGLTKIVNFRILGFC
jgi:hypothetical protein